MSAVVARHVKVPGGEKSIRWVFAAAVIAFAIILPQFYDSGDSFIEDCTYALAYTIMALGLNVVVGFAGLLDLGYVAFFAIGAYTVGWFSSGFFAERAANIHIFSSDFADKLPGWHLNFILILILAAALAAMFGAILGFPTLRLRGDYIAIVTLAFGEIIGRTAVNGDHGVFGLFGNFNLTNGKIGINPIDHPDLPIFGAFTTLDLRKWYYLALFLTLIVVFVNIRLRDSRLGRAWIAVREDEVAAVSMGIPTTKVKLYAYAIGAAMGGMSGAFLGAFIEQVNADQFRFSFSIFVLAMIILGGLGSIWGVIAGAVILSFINSWLIPDKLAHAPQDLFGLDFELTQLGFGIFGFLLVIMMVLRPQGLIPERRRAMELTEGIDSHDDLYEVEHQMSAILETEGLTKIFGGLVAVDDVSFAVEEGSIASIIGPNGAGKTTFFNMLTGLYKPSFGRVVIGGKDMSGKRPDLITKFGVSRTFQNIRLFAAMSALENVVVGRHSRIKGGPIGAVFRPPWIRKDEREAREVARELLSYVGIEKKWHEQLASNLPYGDQRRVEIARALASEPRLLLLDEPTAGMNPSESASLTDFMRKLREEKGMTILLIEHDMKVVMGVSERITVIDHGEKISEGSPQEVRNDPRVIEAYLGKQE